MSDFDDLLSNSTQPLESNPFADSFTGIQSTSEDPWASYDQSGRQNTFENLDSTSFTTGIANSNLEEFQYSVPQTHPIDHEHGETVTTYAAETRVAYETADDVPDLHETSPIAATTENIHHAPGDSQMTGTTFMKQEENSNGDSDSNSYTKPLSTETAAMNALDSVSLDSFSNVDASP